MWLNGSTMVEYISEHSLTYIITFVIIAGVLIVREMMNVSMRKSAVDKIGGEVRDKLRNEQDKIPVNENLYAQYNKMVLIKDIKQAFILMIGCSIVAVLMMSRLSDNAPRKEFTILAILLFVVVIIAYEILTILRTRMHGRVYSINAYCYDHVYGDPGGFTTIGVYYDYMTNQYVSKIIHANASVDRTKVVTKNYVKIYVRETDKGLVPVTYHQ